MNRMCTLRDCMYRMYHISRITPRVFTHHNTHSLHHTTFRNST